MIILKVPEFLYTCHFKKHTGIPCPSCGFTRAAISLGKGHLLESLQYNPSFILFVGVLILLALSKVKKLKHVENYIAPSLYIALVVFIVQWVIKLIYHFN
jgi:hypothetical protein